MDDKENETERVDRKLTEIMRLKIIFPSQIFDFG